MDELSKKITLLSYPIWNLREVQEYFGVGKVVGRRMMDQAILQANGAVVGMPTKIKSESMIVLFTGHTKGDELKILKAGISNGEE